ncbi:MAG: hypothetical protein A3B34_03415 [Candidatus Sungbacteria bacterium RIFCSPLOWO2_01_FULL_54_21]|uniref:Uncharacterized protein n=2 Tax=Candidatus Sungiibacteriota TaxID=1817917 RepID=A0A1G2L522_9BACT|nr:MAG: hypothetical protein A2679_00535 [Candidatus Sungbacteria bacterium RIFCSPHIGHO2_01_FULL_54_26]OHA04152.1 MAG: hypothetical protein A3C92_01870 [Candidatus Sungbacteria bacterium RIFCSPHIGHO2_02_FULL_53_17]OHA06777.1 MAG: hypothetical protein A3B34_03415 [Candidatus Sungbacteria bacterium RIFCSPLOWO2_01_FULL_54_21]
MKSRLWRHFIFRRHFLWFFPRSLSSKIFSLRVKFFQEFFSLWYVSEPLPPFENTPAILREEQGRTDSSAIFYTPARRPFWEGR